MGRFTSPLIAAIAGAGLTAAVVGGVAIAQSSDEVIACVAQTSGNVRIVTSADDCKPNENDMSWSRQGPAGLPGPQGERGPAGATNIVQRFGSPVVVASGRTAGARASCLPGETAVGGGSNNGVPGVHVIGESALPFGNGLRPTIWEVRFDNTSGFEEVPVIAMVLCASP